MAGFACPEEAWTGLGWFWSDKLAVFTQSIPESAQSSVDLWSFMANYVWVKGTVERKLQPPNIPWSLNLVCPTSQQKHVTTEDISCFPGSFAGKRWSCSLWLYSYIQPALKNCNDGTGWVKSFTRPLSPLKNNTSELEILTPRPLPRIRQEYQLNRRLCLFLH